MGRTTHDGQEDSGDHRALWQRKNRNCHESGHCLGAAGSRNAGRFGHCESLFSQRRASAGAKGARRKFANTSVDIPSLAADVDAALLDESRRVVLDVGGDDAGARALGRFKPHFDRFGLSLLAVVNPYRPRSGSVEQIISMLAAMQERARFPITGLVNNANLSHLTQPENLLYGREVLAQVSRETGIPVVLECALEHARPCEPLAGAAFLPLQRYTKPEWMD